MQPYETLRQAKMRRYAALKSERSSWEPRCQEVSEYILPFSGRFFAGDRNNGAKSFNSIYDSTGTRALRILAAGMMAGMTSPARPWFRLATADPELMEVDSVKRWLNLVGQIMRDVFARSNTYRSLHSMYEELGAFGTAATLVDPDYDHMIWNYSLTFGEYAIACNRFGRVDTLYREYETTVANLVEHFVQKDRKSGSLDWSNVSVAVKNMWDRGDYDKWVPVLHVIEPRALGEREYTSKHPKNMAFRSCYLEVSGQEDKVLLESGSEDFPGMAARWHTRGQDTWGNCPGFEALPDVKQLQHEQLRKGQGIDYMVKPPIGLPGETRTMDVDWLPGGHTYLGNVGQSAKAHNLFDVKLDLQHLLLDINDVRQRINQAFYADLFIMLASMPASGRQITAREIAERHEEKLLMLGPVLERLHDEMLSPLIDITFARLVSSGVLQGEAAPPIEMQGQDLKIEFVSTLAQAQRAVGLASVDRLVGTVALIAGVKPDVLDKLDTDQLIDRYSDMLAVDPTLIVADEQVAIVRESRKKQQAAAQALAAAEPLAATVKDLASAKTDEKNALTEVANSGVMEQFTGYR